MTGWEWGSHRAGWPRPLDWVVNEELIARTLGLGWEKAALVHFPAFVVHVAVGIVSGMIFERFRPRRLSRLVAAFVWSTALQVVLLLLAAELVAAPPAAMLGSVIGHGLYAVALGWPRRRAG